MAKEAALEVEVTLTVRAVVSAENASSAELTRFIEREGDAVCGAVAKSVRSRMREVGWLDDDRSVFVTEITEAEPTRDEQPTKLEIVR